MTVFLFSLLHIATRVNVVLMILSVVFCGEVTPACRIDSAISISILKEHSLVTVGST
jgi:hypothetical protein